MAQQFFSFSDPSRAHFLGGFPAKNAAELCTGKLAVLNTDGTLQQATAADAPSGFVQTNRLLTWAPTTQYADALENVTLVSGDVMAVCDNGFFVGSTLPAAGSPLYSAAGGLMDTTGTKPVGKVLGGAYDQRTAPNSTHSIVMIVCSFSGREV